MLAEFVSLWRIQLRYSLITHAQVASRRERNTLTCLCSCLFRLFLLGFLLSRLDLFVAWGIGVSIEIVRDIQTQSLLRLWIRLTWHYDRLGASPPVRAGRRVCSHRRGDDDDAGGDDNVGDDGHGYPSVERDLRLFVGLIEKSPIEV